MHLVKVETNGNAPELFTDDEKVIPIMYALSDMPGSQSNTAQAQRNIKNFAKCGINIVSVDTNLNLGWHKSTDFEIEPMQAEVAGALEANPNAKIILRLHMNPPYWWMRDNPQELVEYNGEPGVDDGETYRLIRNDGNHILHVSLASKKWLEEAGELLKRFCRELSDTVEGESVIGIQVACGVYGEWHQWGIDTGKAMREKFQEFLCEKYDSDVGTVSFAPDPEQPGDFGNFRNPKKSQNIIDSQICLQSTVSEAIIYFCRIIKENWKGDVLTGSFYGYFLSKGSKMQVIMGHMLPENLFKHREYIDFLCGPFPYMENRLPDGVPLSRALLESMRIHKILWITEMDQHPVGTENFVGGDPQYRDETIAQMRRNILLPVVSGMGAWYYDHRIVPACLTFDKRNLSVGSVFLKKGWWDCPELLCEIEKLQNVAGEYLLRQYEPASDVLVVYDTSVYFYQSEFVDEIYALHDAFGRTGISYDCIYLNDLAKCDIHRYKLIVFANTYSITSGQKEIIKKLTKNKTVVWMYASGICNQQDLNVDFVSDLIGIKVRIIPNETAYITEKDFLDNEYVDVTKDKYNPTLAVCDKEAESIAYYEKSHECAAAVKDRVWYFAIPKITVSIAEKIVECSGVHRYIESKDVVFAGNGMVVLNTFHGGEKVITLRNGTVVKCNLPKLTTVVFDACTGERRL